MSSNLGRQAINSRRVKVQVELNLGFCRHNDHREINAIILQQASNSHISHSIRILALNLVTKMLYL